MDYLVRNIRAAGAKRWTAIATQINAQFPNEERPRVGEPLLRKIAYGNRENPGVETIQPILDYFRAVEAGTVALPELADNQQPEAA